ncbi:MAG: winged helix-turn-helix transcriptional regulator [Lachnospiraceae bacterium]|jgi:ArsR family transcriptional regulator|nr:winged helix-turn-helix transcriptional regulator [Lachnospiraceae bacterium]MBR3508228.1 winged helix-turn-helix transcriptional regulator [Lachnospiraceae bacterium]MBR4605409.1 winged helix-turn-helix transcriptional regulator [Lachnospiraceae bacterium]MBR6151344.1 winged helix-turn-helix transcriptional regulator [Lachnospiraceae bacterium]
MEERQENEYLILTPEDAALVEEKLPPEEEIQDLAEFFKVFGDSTRVKILLALLCKEMCVNDIALLLGMNQSAISHQLRILKQMDLVKNRREGKTIFYAPADAHVISILSQGLDHIEE